MEKGLEIYSDGGARGNPGPGACAFVIKLAGTVVAQKSKFLGRVTNNFAEYKGVILALTYLLENLPNKEIYFYLDSELVTRQITGHYKVKNPVLKSFNEEVKVLINKIPTKIIFTNIPRTKNKEADLLVNEELDRNV